MVLGDGVIVLRRWNEADAAALVDCLDGDPEIAIWLDQLPQPYTLADGLAYIGSDRGAESFAITEDDRVLGSIGVHSTGEAAVIEIGYWLRADARGRGVTTRALVLALAYALDDGAARVQLRADPENAASCRVAEKAGFRLEGELRQAHWNPRLGRRQNWRMYSVLAEDRSPS